MITMTHMDVRSLSYREYNSDKGYVVSVTYFAVIFVWLWLVDGVHVCAQLLDECITTIAGSTRNHSDRRQSTFEPIKSSTPGICQEQHLNCAASRPTGSSTASMSSRHSV
uniref:Uncharacterized protein n=1 Tax=Glossina pallidipes TaxID=7398 RepID=A0A1B0A1F5_GLOPL